VEPSLFRKKN